MFLDRKRQDSSFSPLRHQTKYNKKGHATANLNCLDMTFSKVYKELFTRYLHGFQEQYTSDFPE